MVDHATDRPGRDPMRGDRDDSAVDLHARRTLALAESEAGRGPSVRIVTPRGYRLGALIGHGGGGTVYLAEDERLGREVALKFLRSATPGQVERFRREARYTARLNCPSIVQVYELGETNGLPYIAMQYIDGGNLADAELSHVELARVLREVAVALDHAHRAGIVHRDLKPENVLLDRDLRAYVTDFGIARDLCADLGETISHEGQIIGTPGLMPPEQARGELPAIDARSDVYALGATLYAKLTGRHPFVGATLVDVLHAAIHRDPPMPRALNPSIPRGLEAITLRCMQKVREDRPASMRDVAQDLQDFIEGRTGSAESSGWFRRLIAERTGVPVDVPVEDVRTDAQWMHGMEIVGAINAWDADLYRVSGPLTRSFERLDALRVRLDAILEERPDTAWARFYRGVVHARRGRLEEALEDMERSVDRVRDLPSTSFELGRLYLALSLSDRQRATRHISRLGMETDLRNAARRLEQATIMFGEVETRGGAPVPWHRAYARAVMHFAEDDHDGCIAGCDAILDREPDTEEVWKLRGDAMRLAGRDPFESYERALAVRRSYFEVLYTMAEAHIERDDREAARAALARATTIHPEFAEAYALLASIELHDARQDDPDPSGLSKGLSRARDAARRAVALDPSSYDAAIALAEIELERGRRGEPGWYEETRRILDVARALPGCQNRVNLLTARALLERARGEQRAGRDARPLLEEARALAHEPLAVVPDSRTWLAVRDEVDRALHQ